MIMKIRSSILGGAAVLALAATLSVSPAFAKTATHHRTHHAAAASASDQSEEQTTAQLNQQQASNPGAVPSSSLSGINPNSSAANSAQLQNGGPSMAPPANTGTNAATKPTMSGNGGASGSTASGNTH
jgi:hypothetical protein